MVEQECEPAIRSAPDSDAAAAAVGRAAGAFLEAGQPGPLVAWLKAQLASHPRTQTECACQYWLGAACEAAAQSAEAEKAYRLFVDRWPSAERVTAVVGALARLLAGRSAAEAAAGLKEISAKHPGSLADWQARYEQGLLLLQAHHPEQADKVFLALISGKAPEEVKRQARVSRSLLSFRFISQAVQAYAAKDLVAARKLVDRVLADRNLPSEWPLALLTAGRIHHDRGDYGQAAAAFRRVLAEFPTAPEAASAQFLLGESLQAQQKWDQAIAAYELVRERWPQDPLATHAEHRVGACQDGRRAGTVPSGQAQAQGKNEKAGGE